MRVFFRVIVMAGLLVWPTVGYTAIAIDAVSTATEGTSTTSHSHTLSASANLIVVCVAGREVGGAAVNYSTVTVGGQSATRLDQLIQGSVTISELWYLKTPPTGSQTVAVTGDASTDFTITGAISFTGAEQSTTFNTSKTFGHSATNNMDVDTLASAEGELAVLCGAVRTPSGANPTISPDATSPVSTEEYELQHSTDNAVAGVGYSEAGAASSIDMRVDISAAQQVSATAVSIRPAAARRGSSPVIFGWLWDWFSPNEAYAY